MKLMGTLGAGSSQGVLVLTSYFCPNSGVTRIILIKQNESRKKANMPRVWERDRQVK